MRRVISLLIIVIVLLGGWAAALWLLPKPSSSVHNSEKRYGISEGLQLVELSCQDGGKRFAVEDSRGNRLFNIPLRNCQLDLHFHNGRLRFREIATHREGFIDAQGMVTFFDEPQGTPHVAEDMPQTIKQDGHTPIPHSSAKAINGKADKNNPQPTYLHEADLRRMAQTNPFYKEASKVLQGKLSETDAARRKMILNYCEHFRTAYTTKDIDFLRQVFSDNALIIVGHVVQSRQSKDDKVTADSNVSYAIHAKKDYLQRLSKVFGLNKKIDVRFSDFRIMRHPTMDGIYGVSLRQQYKTDRYADDGYLFLLWDFRDKSNPTIHVRTWQPQQAIRDGNEVITLHDFNLE